MSEELTEKNSDNVGENREGKNSGSHRHSHQHHHHHNYRRHHSSSNRSVHKTGQEEKDPGSQKKRSEKRKFRIEQQSKEDHWRKIESRLSRHFLKIIGVIFLLNAIWFLANSSEYFRYFKYYVLNVVLHFGKILDSTGSGPDISTEFLSLILVFLGISILIFLVFRHAIRRHSFELEIIAFCAWLLHSLWWIINFVWTSNIYYLIGYLLAATLFFMLISAANVQGYFPRQRKWKRWLETILILINSFYYFLSGIFALKFLGVGSLKVLFSFSIVLWSVWIILKSIRKSRMGSRVPFMAATAIIASLIFPMLIRVNMEIQFFTVLSVLFLLISFITRHQYSILFSAILMVISLLIFVFQWAFIYLPLALVPGIKPGLDLFFKGLISGTILITAFSINYRLLKRLTISPSFKLINRSTYRKVLKGIIMGLAYLTGFWVFNGLMQYAISVNGMTNLFLSTFNSIYFIFMIPYLRKTGSSYLRFFLFAAAATSLIYPMLVHIMVVGFRMSYIQKTMPFFTGFGFHYLTVILLIVLLSVMQKYKTKAFYKKKRMIRFFWVFNFVMISFVAVTEFSHLFNFVAGHYNGYALESMVKMHGLFDSLVVMIVTVSYLIIGFLRRFRFLRIFSLVMILCLMLKILIMDLPALEFGMRMAFFFILGVITLGISIFYQRLKRFLFLRSEEDLQE